MPLQVNQPGTFNLAAVPAIALLAGSAAAQPDLESWSEMNREVVNARQLIGSDVTNGVTPMGMVADLVLAPDSTEVEYLLFEVPYPVGLWGAGDGFVTFDEVSIEHGLGFDLRVQFDEQESVRLPEELEFTRESVEERLVSRILYEPIEFEEGEELQIVDLLIHRSNGAVTHYVVETDPDAVFRSARRAVPAEEVGMREEGGRAASLRVAELDRVQEFDPGLL